MLKLVPSLLIPRILNLFDDRGEKYETITGHLA
jgi:hypothetical protein